MRRNVARDKVLIASKVYFNPGRLSKEAIHREIDGSLKGLGADFIDLYIIHRFDYETLIEETMEALNDLVRAGRVRALGAFAMWLSVLQHVALRPRPWLGMILGDKEQVRMALQLPAPVFLFQI